MNAWLSNTVIDLKLTFRDRQTLFWSYLFPLLFLFIFSAIFARANPKGVTGILPGLLCISTMAAGFFGLSIGLVTARERGMFRRYQIAPVHPWMILSSQTVSNFLVAFSSLLVQLSLARIIYRVEIAGSIWSLLLMLGLGLMAFLGLGFVIAAVAENAKVALVISNILFYPLMFLSGAAIPSRFLSPSLQKFAQLLPSTYLTDGLNRIILDGEGSRGAVLIVLAATSITGLIIAARLFRWESREPLPLAKKAWAAGLVVIFVIAALLTER